MDAEADPTSAPRPSTPTGSLLAVIGIGMFVTGFGWPGIIGELPFNRLLKDELGLRPHQVTLFWAVATVAWYCKPLLGLITDGWPLGGTRHRGYLLWGSVAAGLSWLGFALVPRAYLPLLALMTALNFALVFVNVVVGGLLVETGQSRSATGRVSAVLSGIDGVIAIAAGPVSGWLAERAFGWTALTGAIILLGYVPVVARAVQERRETRPNAAVWAVAKGKLRTVVGSWPMWAATIVLFLVFLVPSFQTPLYFFQRDALRFSPSFIGTLRALGGLGVLLGAGAYGLVCRYVRLRTSLVLGLALNAVSTLLYLHYQSARSAMIVDFTFGLVGTMSLVPVYDLATRATPKGSESFGFGLLMSVRNVAIYVLSSYLGAVLYEHYGFRPLVWISAVTTAAVLLFVPFLPRALLAGRERGGPSRAPSAA
jgi:predicted MFS family arabinose efflux permease